MNKKTFFLSEVVEDKLSLGELKDVISIAVDTETNSLSPFFPTSKLWSIQFTFTYENDTQHSVLFINDTNRNWDTFSIVRYTVADIIRFLLRPDNMVKLIGHNLKFDLKFLSHFLNLDCNKLAYEREGSEWIYCTSTIEKLLTAGLHESASLDDTLHRYLGVKLEKSSRNHFIQPTFTNSKEEWHSLKLVDYAFNDIVHLHSLMELQKQKLEEKELGHLAELELNCLLSLYLAEMKGIRVDVDGLKEMSLRLSEKQKQDEEEVREELDRVYQPFLLSEYEKQSVEYLLWKQRWDTVKSQTGKRKAKLEGGTVVDISEDNKTKRKQWLSENVPVPKPHPPLPINLNSPKQLLKSLQLYGVEDLDSTDKFTLEGLVGQYPVVDKLLDFRESEKLIQFCDSSEEHLGVDGRIHCDYNPIVSTGRMSCIAEGQRISIPGGYKNIEDVQVGDLVYCYKDDGSIGISKVLNKFDNGEKECVRVRWQSSGLHDIGELICTPDHLIRTKSGEWKQAKDLVRYEKLSHFRRALQTSSNRVRVYSANNFYELEEGLIKREWFKADSTDHIHHINEDKSDNRIENLKVMTKSEHTSHHAKEMWEKGIWRADLYRRPRNPEYIKRGESHPLWVSKSKFQLLRMLAEANGRPTSVDMDFEVYKRKCLLQGINLNEVKKRFSRTVGYISKGKLLSSIKRNQSKISYVATELGIGTRTVHSLCQHYGISSNHAVCSVKPVGVRKVWDLEVEGTHNFIAEEICVHNCSNPNLTQIPSKGELGKEFRKNFIAGEGKKLVIADFTGIELVIVAALSGQTNLIEAINKGMDPHCLTMSLMLSGSDSLYEVLVNLKDSEYEKIKNIDDFVYLGNDFLTSCSIPALEGVKLKTKEGGTKFVKTLRDYIKTLTYGLAYGLGVKGLALRLRLTEEVSSRLFELFHSSYPKIKPYLSIYGDEATFNYQVRNRYGRPRFFYPVGKFGPSFIEKYKNKYIQDDFKEWKKEFDEDTRKELTLPQYVASIGGEEGVKNMAKKKYKAIHSNISRQGSNHIIQSLSADMTKLSIKFLTDSIAMADHLKVNTALLIQCHDELLVETDSDNAEEVKSIVETAMVDAADFLFSGLGVVTKVEATISDYWTK